jgi:hypothetical protein
MFTRQGHSARGISAKRLGAAALALGLALALSGFLSGCASSLHVHATALSAATAPVVNQATEAYRDAESAYELSQDYAAPAAFDLSTPVYNPRTLNVLLTADQIQARLQVLAAFQVYVQDIVAITQGTDSPALEAASKSIGGDVAGITNTLEPSIDSVLGITPETESTTVTTVTPAAGSTTTSSTTSSANPVPLVSSGVQKGLGAAVDMLGQFLVNRTIEKDLPGQVEKMDPVVQQLCQALANDATTLQGEEHRIYDQIINQQTLFLRENKDKMDPGVRQEEIMKLPDLARQQAAADARLNALQAALIKLSLTHHALAAAAQGNNPESLQQKLSDLENAGAGLGKLN